MHVLLRGQRGFELRATQRFVVPDRVMRGSAVELFDFLAECIIEVRPSLILFCLSMVLIGTVDFATWQ
jgi:hypothetical protein